MIREQFEKMAREMATGTFHSASATTASFIQERRAKPNETQQVHATHG
jgi:hypothetical protein